MKKWLYASCMQNMETTLLPEEQDDTLSPVYRRCAKDEAEGVNILERQPDGTETMVFHAIEERYADTPVSSEDHATIAEFLRKVGFLCDERIVTMCRQLIDAIPTGSSFHLMQILEEAEQRCNNSYAAIRKRKRDNYLEHLGYTHVSVDAFLQQVEEIDGPEMKARCEANIAKDRRHLKNLRTIYAETYWQSPIAQKEHPNYQPQSQPSVGRRLTETLSTVGRAVRGCFSRRSME